MTQLKPREYYEDLYDRLTVESARRDTETFNSLYDKFFEIMPDEPRNSHRAIIHLNLVYMQFVGNHLLDRYDRREESIREWMTRDESKDAQIAAACLMTEPVCQHCRAADLYLTDKMFHHRNSFDDPEEVLFILRCSKCRKNSAVWEDGEPLEYKTNSCPKCNAAMAEKDTSKGKILTITYTCPACRHWHKNEFDLTPAKKEIDPDLEKDRVVYCLHDEKNLKELRDAKRRFEEMARLGEEMKERADNQDLYCAIANLKRPKIAGLTGLLAPILGKAGFTEFCLGKPEMNKYVRVGFSCLDSKPDREDAASRKMLQKAIKNALEPTNWRMMSNGVSYRLGCLTGYLRAYENEEDLKKLITEPMLQKAREGKSDKVSEKNACIIKGKSGEEIIL